MLCDMADPTGPRPAISIDPSRRRPPIRSRPTVLVSSFQPDPNRRSSSSQVPLLTSDQADFPRRPGPLPHHPTAPAKSSPLSSTCHNFPQPPRSLRPCDPVTVRLSSTIQPITIRFSPTSRSLPSHPSPIHVYRHALARLGQSSLGSRDNSRLIAPLPTHADLSHLVGPRPAQLQSRLANKRPVRYHRPAEPNSPPYPERQT